jgi:hypothetical protein
MTATMLGLISLEVLLMLPFAYLSNRFAGVDGRIASSLKVLGLGAVVGVVVSEAIFRTIVPGLRYVPLGADQARFETVLLFAQIAALVVCWMIFLTRSVLSLGKEGPDPVPTQEMLSRLLRCSSFCFSRAWRAWEVPPYAGRIGFVQRVRLWLENDRLDVRPHPVLPKRKLKQLV